MKAFDYPFAVNGKDYVLRYSFQARRNFERKNKQSVPGLLRRMVDPQEQMADDLTSVFLMLLSSDHPELKADDVEKMIEDMGGEDPAMQVLTKALQSQAEDAEAENP